MKCKILHESKGRLRIHAVQGRMTLAQADILEAYLLQLPCVTDAKVYDRTCDAVIFYHGPAGRGAHCLGRVPLRERPRHWRRSTVGGR